MVHSVSWADLEFDRVPIEFLSSRGIPQTKWVRVGVPYIPQEIISSVFYLYRTREDALLGRSAGGTGFIVRYDGGPYARIFRSRCFYAVTNWHVVCRYGYSVIRLNTKDGNTDVIDLDCADWHFIAGKYDVAVAPLNIDENIHAVSSVGTSEFLYGLKPNFGKIGVGDDVFMLGLFVDHEGISKNVPSARFGHVSMLPDPQAPIKQPTGYFGESFVIDMHSRSGFSGSPVYVYRTFGHDLDAALWQHHDVEISEIRQWGGDYRARVRVDSSLLKLLGIHWGQFPERWELKEKKKVSESKEGLIVEGAYVSGFSGMTCVIPAWHILEVLDLPKLEELRRPTMAAAQKEEEEGPQPESLPPEATPDVTAEGANPFHREDFTRLLGAAAKKKPQDDQT